MPIQKDLPLRVIRQLQWDMKHEIYIFKYVYQMQERNSMDANRTWKFSLVLARKRKSTSVKMRACSYYCSEHRVQDAGVCVFDLPSCVLACMRFNSTQRHRKRSFVQKGIIYCCTCDCSLGITCGYQNMQAQQTRTNYCRREQGRYLWK